MRTAEPSAPSALEHVALALIGALVVAALLLDAIGGLAGLLFGGGWAGVPLADVPAVAMRLVHHLDDPRAAWPLRARSVLPSAAGFYASAALVAGAAAAAMAVGVKLVLSSRIQGARWAGSRDLRRLIVRRPIPGRVTLGRRGRRLLAAEPLQSLLVVAPTQSGKTTALAVPAILEWQGPLIALSVKTDLLEDTLARRSSMGDVAVFDPTQSTGLTETASWTPLLGCRTWAGARRVARWMTEAAAPGNGGLTEGHFWYSAAAKLLAPLLYAAATAGLTMDEVVAWVDTQEESAVLKALEATDNVEALQAMQANWCRDERQRSSIYTTAETVLEAYADPGVLAHSRTPQITADRLLDADAGTLYLCASAREQRRLRPVFVALLEEVLEAAYARVARQGAPLDPPLLVVLDEVANVAPLPDLDVLVSTAAGHGVQLVTVLQDLAQAHARWGRERADTIVNNHRAKLVGASLADERTLEWTGRLLGDEERRQRSVTVDRAGGRSVSESTTYRALAPANVVREADRGTSLLIYGNLPAAWIQLRPWFRERRLRRLAMGVDAACSTAQRGHRMSQAGSSQH